MAFKTSGGIVINDSAGYDEYATVVNTSGIDSGGFISTASGHTKNLGWGTSLVELTAPDVDYSTGVSNILNFSFDEATYGENPRRFVLKLTGNEARNGFYKGQAVGQTDTSAPGGTTLYNLKVSEDGLHWYFFDKNDNKVKHRTPGTAWAWNSLGGIDDELTITDSTGYFYTPMAISTEGNYFYRSTLYRLYQYDLSTAWDISSATLTNTFKWPFSAQVSNTGPRFNFKRDGTKLLVTESPFLGGSDILRMYDLSTAWDISTATLNKKVNYGLAAEYGNWVSPDSKIIVSQDEGLSTTNWTKYNWLTPWELDSTYSNSFSSGVSMNQSGQQGIFDFVIRPGGHYLYSIGDNTNIYMFNIQDSASSSVPQSFAFPPNVHFEDGYIDFPGDGETSYVEFISIDSGENWYAKELYKG